MRKTLFGIQRLLWRVLISLILVSRSLLTLASSYLEFTLELLHSLFYNAVDTLTTIQNSASRAWWDNAKGSAIVVYCPSTLDHENATAISTAIALRLASLDPTQPQPLTLVSPTSIFSRLPFSSSRALKSSGSPPYTCIVILPDERSIAPLIAAWAERKARLQRTMREAKMMKRAFTNGNWNFLKSTYHDVMSLAFWNNSEELADRESETEFHSKADDSEIDDTLACKDLTASVTSLVRKFPDVSESSTSNERSSPSSVAGSRGNVFASVRAQKKGRRRSISWGAWTAPDIVGFGRDMMKGLKIGQSGRRGMGSVIPVVMSQSPEALTFARSTIQAYCSGHDLLLRGLIIIPSIMVPNTSGSLDYASSHLQAASSAPGWEDDQASAIAKESGHLGSISPHPLEASEMSVEQSISPPLSPRSALQYQSSVKRNDLLDRALKIDVTATSRLVDTLLPTLKRDAGRIVALIPSGWGAPVLREPEPEPEVIASDDNSAVSRGRSLEMQRSFPQLSHQALIFTAVRESLQIMWKQKSRELRRSGVRVSLVITASVQDMNLPSYLHATDLSIKKSLGNTGLSETDDRKSSSLHCKTRCPSTFSTIPRLSDLVNNTLETLHFISNPPSRFSLPDKLSRMNKLRSKSAAQISKKRMQISAGSPDISDRFEPYSKDSMTEASELDPGELVSCFSDRQSMSEFEKKQDAVSSRDTSEVDEEELVSPLFELILSSLSRSRPRSRYVNGLGPRIEELCQEIVGARFLRDLLGAWVRG